MTQRIYSVLYNGNPIIPVTNGTYQTADQSTSDANNCAVYIEFYSDAAGLVPVTPTAGTIGISASPLGNDFLAPASNASINASACAFPTSTYTPPLIPGRIVKGQVVLAGITGANYAQIIFWRY